MKKVREKINREMRSGIYTILMLKAVDSLGETYGYEIQRYIAEKTGGKIKLKDATVYPVLRYLARKNILNSYWTEPSVGVPRKYYTLTEEGRKLLNSLIRDFNELVEVARKVLGGEE